MASKALRKRVRALLNATILLATLSPQASEALQQATRVPGSEHLLLQTDFPYQYWRPSPRPYTPTVPPSPTTTPTSYGFYYGESQNDHETDASTWQMLPIQIHDDLVGDFNERTTMAATPPPGPVYPTTVTPQYGRYPGVTERPHLFHPERLYTSKEQNEHGDQDLKLRPNRRRRPHRQYSSQEAAQLQDQDLERYQIPQPPQRLNRPRNPQAPWHQSIFDQVEPVISTHIPQAPKLPNLPSMNSISGLASWPFSNMQEEESKPKVPGTKGQHNGVTESTGEILPHQFFAIPSSKTPRRKPGEAFADGEETIILSTPSNYDVPQSVDERLPQTVSQRFEMFNHLYPNINQDNQGNQNSFFDNPLHFIKKQIRPMANRKRLNVNRRRPHRRIQFHNRPVNQVQRPQASSNDPWETHFLNSQTQEEDYHFPRPSSRPNSPRPINGRPGGNRFRPNPQGHPHPFHSQRPKPNYVSVPDSSHNQRPSHHQGTRDRYPTNPTAIKIMKPIPAFTANYGDYDYESDLIDRLTDANPLTSSVALPSGMLVVALALALFYFNFVWYPTPVVTARLIKLLSDSAPSNLLDSEKQKAIGEAYEVFRSLETEYMRDPTMWQPSCKARLVCQVHQELPKLWQITHAYEAVVRSSLATGPQGDDNLNGYLEAAEKGSKGSDCNDMFKSCPIEPVPVKATLQRLLGIADDHQSLSKVVYS